MAKRYRITGPGRIVDRSARNGKITIGFDPSPNAFITESRKDKGRLDIKIEAQSSEMKPITISVSPKQWLMKLEDAMIPSDRLADLEALITEEEDVHVTVEYSPAQDKLPGMESRDAGE